MTLIHQVRRSRLSVFEISEKHGRQLKGSRYNIPGELSLTLCSADIMQFRVTWLYIPVQAFSMHSVGLTSS